ncbi:hypothetical protein PaG_05965 [Moesziomyces aphidis]|uniref:SAM domain-containing protein n=1 Tax=Moesziomyces aphidis TaxID=84754 RepID=W3VGP7_MOEAP|nr:hypothetical protein PaG_05965 [Moesziomyces aphidis]
MASTDPPAISTPSRPRYSLNPKRSGSFAVNPAAPNVAGFSPGGQVFEGYSYLTRSTSMSTSTRSRPKGLQTATPPAPPAANLPGSPSSPRFTRLAQSPPTSPFGEHTELPRRSKTIHRISSSISTPELHSFNVHPARSVSESERLAEAVANLPHNPKAWLPSQVALYLTHVLGLVPRPVVEDVTAYVRSSRMGGRAFLRLSESDLERQGLNLKWRKLMVEAGRKLRRDALRGRIWGNESGSLRWPKSAHDLAREEAEELDDSELRAEKDGIVRSSSTTSKLTLKRMRDSRKVRGIIHAFQTEPMPTANPSSSPVDSVFGEGYVRGQAQQILSESEQKKLSLRRPLRPRRSTADFPWLETAAGAKKEDIEALLSALTEQEANELASELGLNDLDDTDAVGRALQQDHADSKHKMHLADEASGESADEVALMPALTRHGSEDSLSFEGDTSVSECSATESEAVADADTDSRGHKPRYSVLDEDVIRAILAEADHAEAGQPTADGAAAHDQEEPAKAQLTRSHTTASILRPERPYRASLYTEEELASLDTDPLHIRTESSRELVEALGLSEADSIEEDAEPQFGTARLRSAEERALDALALPNFEQPASSHQNAESRFDAHEEVGSADKGEYIFMPPEPSSRKPLSQVGSIRRAGRDATFGSRRGKAVLSLLKGDSENSELFASLPGATMLRQKSNETRKTMAAENEEGWGGTLGRSSSRKSLNSVFEGPKPSSMLCDAVNFPRRSLDRVASEAEIDLPEPEIGSEADSEDADLPAQKPVDRYEDSANEGDADAAMLRRPSVEQRLSSLFNEAGAEKAADEAEPQAKAEAEPEAAVVASAEDLTQEEPSEDAPAEPTDDQEPSLDADAHRADAEDVIDAADDVAVEADAAGPADAVAADAVDAADAAGETVEEKTELVAEPLPAPEQEVTDAESEPVDEPAVDAANSERIDSIDTVTIEPELERRAGSDSDDFVAIVAPATADETAENGVGTQDSVDTASVPAAEIAEPAAAADTASKLLVPLTVIEPHPSGTGSISKRSMVLVDRRRFESLARRMTDLEQQLESIDRSPSSRDGSVGTGSNLRDMFSAGTDDVPSGSEADEILGAVLAATSEAHDVPVATASKAGSDVVPVQKGGWWRPSSWVSYLSSLNPYYAEPSRGAELEEELSLDALLGRPESEHEKQLLAIGAIPAYMLGLGAGVGFVLVREVLAKGIGRS